MVGVLWTGRVERLHPRLCSESERPRAKLLVSQLRDLWDTVGVHIANLDLLRGVGNEDGEVESVCTCWPRRPCLDEPEDQMRASALLEAHMAHLVPDTTVTVLRHVKRHIAVVTR